MQEIHISFEEMQAVAAGVRYINDELTDCLFNIQRLMNQLESYWESDTSSLVREKFNQLRPHFEQYAQVVAEYIQERS